MLKQAALIPIYNMKLHTIIIALFQKYTYKYFETDQWLVNLFFGFGVDKDGKPVK